MNKFITRQKTAENDEFHDFACDWQSNFATFPPKFGGGGGGFMWPTEEFDFFFLMQPNDKFHDIFLRLIYEYHKFIPW